MRKLVRLVVVLLAMVRDGLKGRGALVSPGDARAALDRRGIEFTERAFFDAAYNGDLAVVNLFVATRTAVPTSVFWSVYFLLKLVYGLVYLCILEIWLRYLAHLGGWVLSWITSVVIVGLLHTMLMKFVDARIDSRGVEGGGVGK